MKKTQTTPIKKSKRSDCQPEKPQTLNWNELLAGRIEKLGVVIPLAGHEPAVASRFDAYSCSELRTLIDEAADELVARGCHFSKDRWQSPTAAGARVDEDEVVAKWLQENLASRSAAKRRLSEKEHKRLVENDRIVAIQSIRALAEAAYRLTCKLESLANEQAELMQEVAPHFPEWPCNLGLKRVATKNGGIKCELQRAKTAKAAMENIKLGLIANNSVETTQLAGNGSSPFRIAAMQVYNLLCLMQKNPHRYFDHSEGAGPADELGRRAVKTMSALELALFGHNLTLPIKNKNASDWWAAAKFVSGRSKPARSGRMKTSHFEGGIASGAAVAAQRRGERTQRELTAFNINFGGQWLVPTAHCA